MANQAPPYSTYVNSAENKRVITDYISLLDPSDAPFVEAIGGLDGAASKFRFTNQGTLVEWIEDTLAPLAGTFANSGDLSVTSATALTVGDANMVQPGHILLIGSELVWVSANTSGTLTVTRAFGSTSGATIASHATFSIVGMARLEGDDSDPIGYTDLSTNSNYTQIFHKEIKQTGTAPYQDRYGMGDQMQYESAKSIPEMMRLIERTLQYGTVDAGSTTAPRTMGGYRAFITTNLTTGSLISASSSAGIAEIESAVELAYTAGGSGDYLAIVNPATYRKIKSAYDSSAYIRFAPEQNRFGTLVDTIVTPFGNVGFVIDRWQLSSYIPILKVDNVGMLTLRPWQVEDLAKTGDAEKKQLIGEFTFCLKLEKSHALMTSVS